MGIILNTFNGGSVTPKSDGKIFEKATPINGIISGCALSHLGTNQVQVTAGMGIVKGRRFEVTLETLQVALATSGAMNGRIYVRINLSDSVTPIKFLSVCATTLPALTQDADINDTNGIWEMELATYSATTTVISALTTTYLTVKKSLTENSIVNANTTTEAGYVADARQLNPNVEGSFANTVNESLTWKLIGSSIGTTVITKDFTLYKELRIVTNQFNGAIQISHNENDFLVSPLPTIANVSVNLWGYYFGSSPYYGMATAFISKSAYNLRFVISDGVDKTTSCTTEIWAR